jgi:hypothetical protein
MAQAQKYAFSSALLLASVLRASTVLPAGASVDSATKAELKTATQQYERGVDAMDAEKYAEALTFFQQSYETVNSPNSRLRVGRALAKLGKLPEAYRELSQTLKQSLELAASQKKYKKTVETVQKELDEIKGKLAYVTIRQGAQLQLQGQTIAPSNWQEPQPVMPGAVSVDVTFTDGRNRKQQLTLKAGERAEVAIAPPPASVATQQLATTQSGAPTTATSHGSSGMRRTTVGIIFGTVGLVGVGTFVGFALVAAPSYGNSKAGCAPQGCPESAVDNEGSKARMQGIGYASLGVGIVGLGVGTWLILSGDSKSETTTALQLSPAEVRLTHRF